MADSIHDRPTSCHLCGDFPSLTDAESDQGRAYSAPIVQDCAVPTVVIAGSATLSFVDDEPLWTAD